MKKSLEIPDYVVELAKQQRKNPTEAEKIVWELLRNRRFNNYKFRRQQPVYRYIFDFVCIEKKIAIEIDGEIHRNTKEYDAEKDSFVKAAGFKILRIKNEVIEKSPDVFLDLLNRMIKET